MRSLQLLIIIIRLSNYLLPCKDHVGLTCMNTSCSCLCFNEDTMAFSLCQCIVWPSFVFPPAPLKPPTLCRLDPWYYLEFQKVSQNPTVFARQTIHKVLPVLPIVTFKIFRLTLFIWWVCNETSKSYSGQSPNASFVKSYLKNFSFIMIVYIWKFCGLWHTLKI